MFQTVLKSTMPSMYTNQAFPHAPDEWSLEKAVKLAAAEGITLTEEHVKVLLDQHEYFFHHEERINFREMKSSISTVA